MSEKKEPNASQKTNSHPLIGDVYLMRFDGHESEQAGWRPGVVFQNNVGNSYSPNIIALPLTSSIKKQSQPTHVLVFASDTGLQRDSMVLCENPEKMSKVRVGRYLTSLPAEYMKKIAVASLLATAAISYLNEGDLLDTWREAIKLNCDVA